MKKPIYEPTTLDHVAGVQEPRLEFRRGGHDVFSGAAASHGFVLLHAADGGQKHATQAHKNRISASRPHKGQGEYFTWNVYKGTSYGFTRVFLF